MTGAQGSKSSPNFVILITSHPCCCLVMSGDQDSIWLQTEDPPVILHRCADLPTAPLVPGFYGNERRIKTRTRFNPFALIHSKVYDFNMAIGDWLCIHA